MENPPLNLPLSDWDDGIGDEFLSTFSLPVIQNSADRKELCLTDPARLNKPVEKFISQDSFQHIVQTSDEILTASDEILTEPTPVQVNWVTDGSIQQPSAFLVKSTKYDSGHPHPSTNNLKLVKAAVDIPSTPTPSDKKNQRDAERSVSVESQNRQPLWKQTEKCQDPEEERRRVNAIKAKNNRTKQKEKTEKLQLDLKKIIAERDELMKTVEEGKEKDRVIKRLQGELQASKNENAALQKSLDLLLGHVLQDQGICVSNSNMVVPVLLNNSVTAANMMPTPQDPTQLTRVPANEYFQFNQKVLSASANDQGSVNCGSLYPVQVLSMTDLQNAMQEQIIVQSPAVTGNSAVQVKMNPLTVPAGLGIGSPLTASSVKGGGGAAQQNSSIVFQSE